MDLSGKVIQILPLQTGEGRNGVWKKQDYIVETQGQYPKKVCFSVWGDKISQFNIQENEFITIGMDIESREYNSRWYTDIKAWKVDRPGTAGMAAPASQNTANTNAADPNDPFESTPTVEDPFASGNDSSSADDDLPF